MTPQGAERKACVTDFEDDENTFFVQDFKGNFVKAKYLGINHLGMFCFEAIETGNIHGASDFRNVWLAKTDDK